MENMATLANISNFIHRNCMGLNFCKEKLGRKNCQTLFQKSTDKENTHTHTHTHTQSRKSWYQWDLPQTHTKIHEPKVFDNLWQFEGLLKNIPIWKKKKTQCLHFTTLKVKVAQSCQTLFDPMDCTVHGISRSGYWKGSCSLLPDIFPTLGLNTDLPHCRWILYQLSHREAQKYWSG